MAKKKTTNRKASSDSGSCAEGIQTWLIMAVSMSATKWKTIPRPTVGIVIRVRTCRPPHSDARAQISPNPYKLKATRNQNSGIDLNQIIVAGLHIGDVM